LPYIPDEIFSDEQWDSEKQKRLRRLRRLRKLRILKSSK
jgi:hypothetical protein